MMKRMNWPIKCYIENTKQEGLVLWWHEVLSPGKFASICIAFAMLWRLETYYLYHCQMCNGGMMSTFWLHWFQLHAFGRPSHLKFALVGQEEFQEVPICDNKGLQNALLCLECQPMISISYKTVCTYANLNDNRCLCLHVPLQWLTLFQAITELIEFCWQGSQLV